MNWRRPPEGAAWICLAMNFKGDWHPIAFGVDETDCISHASDAMKIKSLAGAQFFGKHIS